MMPLPFITLKFLSDRETMSYKNPYLWQAKVGFFLVKTNEPLLIFQPI